MTVSKCGLIELLKIADHNDIATANQGVMGAHSGG
jgi:hypothetical protein